MDRRGRALALGGVELFTFDCPRSSDASLNAHRWAHDRVEWVCSDNGSAQGADTGG